MRAARSIIALFLLALASAACADGPIAGVYQALNRDDQVVAKVKIEPAKGGSWSVAGTYGKGGKYAMKGTISKSGRFRGTIAGGNIERNVDGYWNEYRQGLTLSASKYVLATVLEPVTRTDTHSHGNLDGTWECKENGVQTATVSGSPGPYTISIEWKGNTSQSGDQEATVHAGRQGGLVGNTHNKYKDQDKTVAWTGTVEMTFSGESFVLKTTYKTREFFWKPGVTHYESDSNVARPDTSTSRTFTRK